MGIFNELIITWSKFIPSGFPTTNLYVPILGLISKSVSLWLNGIPSRDFETEPSKGNWLRYIFTPQAHLTTGTLDGPSLNIVLLS